MALLGLRIALGDVVALGVAGVALAAGTPAITFAFTVWLGARLGVRRGLTMLIAAGCSICGAAAIAAIRPVTDADDQDAGRAIAAIAVLGTVAMAILPFVGTRVLGLSDSQTGMWAGASIHEVAQVAGAGAALSVAALKTATLIKLARVVLLAPTVALAGAGQRRGSAPAIPGFVLAFIALVLVRTFVALPAVALDAAAAASGALLTAGLCGVCLQVRGSRLLSDGLRPVVLAVAASLCAAIVGLTLVRLLPLS